MWRRLATADPRPHPRPGARHSSVQSPPPRKSRTDRHTGHCTHAIADTVHGARMRARTGTHGARRSEARTPPAPRPVRALVSNTENVGGLYRIILITVMHQRYGCLHSMHGPHTHVTHVVGFSVHEPGPDHARRRARRGPSEGTEASAPTPRSGRGQRSERSAPPCLVSLHPPRSAYNHRNLRGGDCRLCKCAGSGLCCRVERNATKACRCAPCTRMCGFYL